MTAVTWCTTYMPTPDHYLPLLYIAGTRASSEPVTFPVEGVDGGSVSMLAVRIARSSHILI